MMNSDNSLLDNFFRAKHRTLLGVGPMSINCINATIELANEYRAPLLLIASRRQIDSEDFGGGYVNNWTTAQFAQYVSDHDKNNQIILARDHGGPWQNTKEIDAKLTAKKAMESAKNSFLADLEAGFHILHIDTCIDIHTQPNVKTLLERNFELYEYAWTHARRLGKNVIFEIGTEEQGGGANNADEFEYILQEFHKFCDHTHLPKPTFIVAQTATHVMERKNVGDFSTQTDKKERADTESKITQLLEICSRYDIFMKAHNVDYLSDEALIAYPRLGIHAANVAPEFGVTETVALITLLRNHGLNTFADQFLQVAYNSRKWEKWMLPNTKANDTEKAIIAGHYVFANETCLALKEEAKKTFKSKNIELDDYLKECVKLNIRRYLENFNVISKPINNMLCNS